jgi:hypothetical protein
LFSLKAANFLFIGSKKKEIYITIYSYRQRKKRKLYRQQKFLDRQQNNAKNCRCVANVLLMCC